MTVPKPLRIFHITAIPNLKSIAQRKVLYANSILLKRKMQHANIAYQGAQGKRAAKMVAKPPGGVIHNYVPFYFAPRSPMLFTINKGNVPDCPYRQQDIVHLVSTVEIVNNEGLQFVFYDYNATLDYASCYNDIKDLEKIDWDLFHEKPLMDGYCRYWHNIYDMPRYALRQESRQAEFLVYKEFPLRMVHLVGTFDEAKAAEVRQIFDKADINIEVSPKPAWYF